MCGLGHMIWPQLDVCNVRMSAAVSMSMKQSSSFEESCLLNVGISWSMDMVKCHSLCVMPKVSMYACIVLCTGSSLSWEGLNVVGVS